MSLSQQANLSQRRIPPERNTKALPAGSGKQLKLRGLRLAEAKHKEALAIAQLVAQMLGRVQEAVCADDVFKHIDPKVLGNAAGSIFSGPEWEPSGIRKSTREGRRAGLQRTWRLRRSTS